MGTDETGDQGTTIKRRSQRERPTGAELHKRQCNGRAEASRVEGRDDPVKFPSKKAGQGGWRDVWNGDA